MSMPSSAETDFIGSPLIMTFSQTSSRALSDSTGALLKVGLSGNDAGAVAEKALALLGHLCEEVGIDGIIVDAEGTEGGEKCDETDSATGRHELACNGNLGGMMV
ncbi:hypothetical protein PspLS_08011 [Pyricularia sp. CBS 133598]|nr:hypothetical protein PspLS_08011 [Pyricularia sp. CBS 133598]